jgi:hypothetical protein
LLQVALDIAQHATASMGKFDKIRSKAEAPRALKKQRVRDFLFIRFYDACNRVVTVRFFWFQTGNEFNKTLSEEKDSSMGIFNRLMGKSTEKNSFDVNSAARGESGAKLLAKGSKGKKGKK